jgi:16S rRNA (guanine1207-N2)-methyltransferase
VDASALAVEASRRTAQRNGMPTRRIWASDVFSDVRHRYRTILSNPPFHVGVKTDLSIVESFLRQAAARLRWAGRLRMVANRFLPYRRVLKACVGTTRVVAENSRYAVYEASRPARSHQSSSDRDLGP